MKNKLQIRHILVALALGMLLTAAASAQRVVGGYKSISADDKDAVAAAKFAAGEKEVELVSVVTAERQVVAGTNFKLCLEVNDDSGTKNFMAVVYHNLQNEYKLTSWDEQKCGK
jgi:Aspartic acid proteinase inhibitor